MSKKVKYYYDTESLAYKKIKTKQGRKFGYAALFLVSSALFGFLCFIILDHGSCSRVHAALVWHKHLERSFLVDLGSSKYLLFIKY